MPSADKGSVYLGLSKRLNVSRETDEALEFLVRELEKWQKVKNLVAQDTLAKAWERHVADSLQLLLHADFRDKHTVDMGAGAGFPGLVLAIYAKYQPENSLASFTLIEANHKKCAFIREITRKLSLPVTVLNCRLEDAEAALEEYKLEKADIITARALASLDQLLTWGCPILREGGKMVFLKGARHEEEIAEAQEKWRFRHEKHASETEAGAAILSLSGIAWK